FSCDQPLTLPQSSEYCNRPDHILALFPRQTSFIANQVIQGVNQAFYPALCQFHSSGSFTV
ncbi:TPA: hypothetical protein MIR63_27145, partial [Klebsiella pneumoniae]|nr:hypothetical protein [Klebsiella pneumoniae]HBY2119225.1 hypothetical protein [Klebsiella pneumoniae]